MFDPKMNPMFDPMFDPKRLQIDPMFDIVKFRIEAACRACTLWNSEVLAFYLILLISSNI